ncbi:Leucine dehydrogenase [Moorella thermoacetica]|uniref:Leucine dehydrogenase n=1 Tax=Neomoorella thermoacetica TaxID=1525 RepID=A0AAC9HJR0_NEOTH|nr:Glu/Leu/Phe/Val dehydrogenase dimerization domain-containing protein [Moorella thermoacetica]AOQ25104.1 Leucine dehydrogenase [Moorella thermoacetica]TYL15365.1 Leucine dehydrogenase [Moorella thermoacetica]
MEIFKYMEKYGYEQLVMCHDRTSGLKTIICIHDTTLGPALGGLRMWPYASEDEAVLDALRLARGMTYKNAAAGLNLGGGKAVIIGNPRTDKSEELFRAFGRFVDTLGGRYITAEDVGTCVDDMEYIRLETKHVAGLAGLSGDPSPVTAYGAYMGMKATALVAWGNDSLKGKVVAVQGLGHVGYALCRHLAEEGATLIVTDLNPEAVDRVVKEFKASAVAPEEIYGVECDIYSPNALGGTINDDTLPQFKCKVIAGAANNQLKEERHGDILREKGILYAPDYIINAGGVINIAEEMRDYNRERALKKAAGIYDRVLKVFKIAEEYKIPTYVAADRLAEERIARIHNIHHTYLPR